MFSIQNEARLHELLTILVGSRRNEATIQADIREALLCAISGLGREDAQVESIIGDGDNRRIDIEIGLVIFELKRDLTHLTKKDIEQLAGYIEARQKPGTPWTGVLTDGRLWVAFHLREGVMVEISRLHIKKPNNEAFREWLYGIQAPLMQMEATATHVRRLLGYGSTGYQIDVAWLTDLYKRNKAHPEISMKRTLWARLLTTALGTQFRASDALFVKHTLLVNSAGMIAHAALGLDITKIGGQQLLTGHELERRGIHGVVEADFFDWVTALKDEGEAFLRSLAKRLSRFHWHGRITSDVMKALYESTIPVETRKKLGEYNTVGWLAEKMVSEAIERPLEQRVLDPACGSGTFLFYAIRRLCAAAEAQGLSNRETLDLVTRHIAGIDLHPVSVTLARVTYLLAIGIEKLRGHRKDIRVPVYIGDSVHWNRLVLERWNKGELVVQTKPKISPKLRFPIDLLGDAGKFDNVVTALVNRASKRKRGSKVPNVSRLLSTQGVPQKHHARLQLTFQTMCSLHDNHRDHIWGYYVRNVARPMWLARPENGVDVLIGNPPWLAYRFMPRGMQERFKSLCKERGLWHGGAVATQQDLSALFIARAVELYLRDGGNFAFVAPSGILDRSQYKGFRSGDWGATTVGFRASWDLKKVTPHFFPLTCAVVQGTRGPNRALNAYETEKWEAKIPKGARCWSDVDTVLKRVKAPDRYAWLSQWLSRVNGSYSSPYDPLFHNGATIFPRLLFMVERVDEGLGTGERTPVRSVRSKMEKPPWKTLDSVEGAVEGRFLREAMLGEHVLPFRLRERALSVIPEVDDKILGVDDPEIEEHQGLREWLEQTSGVWDAERTSKRNSMSLSNRLDYHRNLSAQFPIPKCRVLYTKSGMHVSAMWTRGTEVIENTLYWAPVSYLTEARFLVAVLNSTIVTQGVRPMMSCGHNPRHIDKYVWRLPIPAYSSANPVHQRLVELSELAEKEIAALDLQEGEKKFPWQRQEIRSYLTQSDVGQEIESLVEALLAAEARRAETLLAAS
jgi:hypothetical protein